MLFKFTVNIELQRTCSVEADTLEEAYAIANTKEWEMEGEELIVGEFYQEGEDEDNLGDLEPMN